MRILKRSHTLTPITVKTYLNSLFGTVPLFHNALSSRIFIASAGQATLDMHAVAYTVTLASSRPKLS